MRCDLLGLATIVAVLTLIELPRADASNAEKLDGRWQVVQMTAQGKSIATGLLLACLTPTLESADARRAPCTPRELRTDSTPTCISIEWDVTGDSDRDATCGVSGRRRRPPTKPSRRTLRGGMSQGAQSTRQQVFHTPKPSCRANAY